MGGSLENFILARNFESRSKSRFFFWDAAFLLTVGSFLLTGELFYLQVTLLASLLTIGAFLLTI